MGLSDAGVLRADAAASAPPTTFAGSSTHLHQRGIGVLLDWVPAHFPRDAHGLAQFDGTALYEHADPRLGEHRDWNTLIFNYGRNEVRNFLTSSALFWLREFHIDGLRVDAVASMLYLDYSRKPGEWLPNRYRRTRESRSDRRGCKELNEVTHGESPGTMIIAEESTAWPQVTRPTYVGRPRFHAEVEHGLDERHAGRTCSRIRCIASTTTAT